MTLPEGLDHLSQLSLDLLLLGDLGESAASDARRHMKTCASCRQSFESMERAAQLFDREVFVRTQPKSAERPVLAVRPRRAGGRTSRALAAAALAATAAAITLIAVWHGHDSQDGASDLLPKGSSHVTVFVRASGSVKKVADGDRLRPHDALRFVVDPGGHPFVMIGSVDGAGKATIYLPYGGKQSMQIAPNRRFEDPSAIELDETAGPERIFALFSDRSLASVEVVAALARVGQGGAAEIRRTRELAVPAVTQESLLVER